MSRGVLGIRWLASGLAVVLTVAAVAGVGAIAERNARAALRHEIEARLQLQARNLAASSAGALLGDYPELTLVPLLKELRTRQPELALAQVLDHRERIQGDSDPRLLGTPFRVPAGFGAPVAPRSPAELLRASGPLLVARSPVLQAGGGVIGAAYVALPLRVIDDRLRASRREQLLALALLTLVGAAAAFLLMSQLLRPVGALRAGLERIGRGDLDTPIRLRDRTELGLLAGSVNEMAAALKRAQAEMLERERLAHEVELARDIQRSLLPAQAMQAGGFDIRGDQLAAAEVGGDYWDVLPLPDGRIGIAIADVAGKGLAGCLVMSMLSALLRALRNSHASPSELLAALDERLSESLRPGVFVTMCYGVLDPRTGHFTFASAGHNPLLIWRKSAGAIEARATRGIPLGAVRGGAIRATLRDETVQFMPGDVCVQFTDGYSEAFRGGGDEEFGLERIERSIREHAASGGEAVRTGLATAVRAWTGDGPLADDETLVVLTCGADLPGAAAGPAPESEDEAGMRGALELLERAERHARPFERNARLAELAALDGWTRALPGFATLSADRLEVIVTAIYEVCSNIVEHGCNEDGRPGLAVHWLPCEATGSGSTPAGPGLHDAARTGGDGLLGQFVIRDDGRPFRPHERTATDFNDPSVRTKGRGIGLEIIHRAVSRITYHSATPRGNITVLAIGPGGHDSRPEGTGA